MAKKKSKSDISSTEEKPSVVESVKSSPAPSKDPNESRLISVDYFATMSVDRGNVELLGGFIHDEKKNLRFRDTKKNYASRYEEFKRR